MTIDMNRITKSTNIAGIEINKARPRCRGFEMTLEIQVKFSISFITLGMKIKYKSFE